MLLLVVAGELDWARFDELVAARVRCLGSDYKSLCLWT